MKGNVMTIEERVERLERLLTDTTTESDTAEDIEANHRQEMAKKLHDAAEGGYEVHVALRPGLQTTGKIQEIYGRDSVKIQPSGHSEGFVIILRDITSVEPVCETITEEPESGIENEKWERHGFWGIVKTEMPDPLAPIAFIATVSDLGNIDSEKTANLIAVAPELAKAALEYVNSASERNMEDETIDIIRLLRKAGIQNVAPWYTDE